MDVLTCHEEYIAIMYTTFKLLNQMNVYDAVETQFFRKFSKQTN